MSRINPNAPAFPRPASEYTKYGTLHDGNEAVPAVDGLTVRQEFAARIMAGFGYDDPGGGGFGSIEQARWALANEAVLRADALIERLNATTGSSSTPSEE